MTAKDNLYETTITEPGDFVFDERVVNVFPDMINRSVPGYGLIVPMTAMLARRYAQAGTRLYDLGCSLGAVTLAMCAAVRVPDARLVAVDASPGMIEGLKRHLEQLAEPEAPLVETRLENLLDTPIEQASVVVLNFTLQFIPLELGFALLCTAMAMAVSVYRYSGGYVTPGEAVAVVFISLEFSRTLLLIGEFFFAGALGREVAGKIIEFLDEKAPVEHTDSRKRGVSDSESISVELRDVTFTYPGAEEATLKKLNMTIGAGETVALIGKSGSGKTTVTNLMLRTLDPDSGEILLGGIPEKELDVTWIREQIALVPQDPYLFFGTVRENLRIAKQDATDEEMLAALKSAELADFVTSSPAGLATMVGDQGLALSGGQAQRLAIARAVLKDAPIVVLDEPTSQIDVETEALLNRALERLCANKTVLLIAHRLSTIERADRIVVLADGAVVESGTREELLAAGGLYAGMIRTKQEIEHAAMVPAAAV